MGILTKWLLLAIALSFTGFNSVLGQDKLCKLRVKGQRVISQDVVSTFYDNEESCIKLCDKHSEIFMRSADGPREFSCYYDNLMIKKIGELPTEKKNCIVRHHKSNEVYNYRSYETKSMCIDNYRTNVRFRLQMNNPKNGYHVNIFFDEEKVFEDRRLARCEGNMVGVRVVRNPGFSSDEESENICLDKCEKMYDRYQAEAGDDPRALNCYYGGERVRVFGDLGEKKPCHVVDPKTGETIYKYSSHSKAVCLDDFRQNKIFKLTRKYPNQTFHVNLVYQGEVIRDYYHAVECSASVAGIQPLHLKNTKMLKTTNECKSFCREVQRKEASKAEGDPRWTYCRFEEKTIAKYGYEPNESSRCPIVNRETGEEIDIKVRAKTKSLCRYNGRYRIRYDYLAKYPDLEHHLDVYFQDEVIYSFDKFATCNYFVKVGTRSVRTSPEKESEQDCRDAIKKDLDRMLKYDPQGKVTVDAKYAGEVLDFDY